MLSAEQRLSPRHAALLGLLHGPAELLPVSSSAHTTLLPWLAGWPYAALDGELRKSFELALHAGTTLALVLVLRDELLAGAAAIDRSGAGVLVLSLAPAALAGYTLRGRIEQRLGGPHSIAAGLAAGGALMALADLRGRGARASGAARAADGLALGIAQASALMPGVSRNGATLAAARARGFHRRGAQELSWSIGIPVLLGVSLLEGARLLRDGLPAAARAPFAIGSAAAFASTLATARVLHGRAREGWALLPFAIYRLLLAAVVILRSRRGAAAR
jgi:undecaprenyl-diphosphatase